MGRYLHPIEKKILNPNFEFLVSCFFYFAVSAAAPFSGGHLNPSVTLAFSRLRKKVDVKIYMASQVIGALLGAGIGTSILTQPICFSEWCL
jgi:glycerol uptake facilitator-like aquaporin